MAGTFLQKPVQSVLRLSDKSNRMLANAAVEVSQDLVSTSVWLEAIEYTLRINKSSERRHKGRRTKEREKEREREREREREIRATRP